MFRFLELAQLHANQEDESVLLQYQVQGSYDSELLQLQDAFQGKIVHLLSDTVRGCGLKNQYRILCAFLYVDGCGLNGCGLIVSIWNTYIV